jgi:hypothetical protein
MILAAWLPEEKFGHGPMIREPGLSLVAEGLLDRPLPAGGANERRVGKRLEEKGDLTLPSGRTKTRARLMVKTLGKKVGARRLAGKKLS